jgi:hypothetical protein
MDARHPLSDNELRVISRVLQADFPGAVELRLHATVGRAVRLDLQGGPVLEFILPADVMSASVTHPVPVEAEGQDLDGTRIHFLLHVRDGVLKELEIYREDGQQIQRLPNADSLSVTVNSG